MIVRLFEIDGTGDLRVHGCSAQFFGIGLLPNGCLYQRRTGKEKPRAFGHEHRIGHDGKISAAGDTHAHDGRDLRNAERAHHGVVAEDAAEVVGVGEDIFLQWKEDAGGVDQVEGGNAVLEGDGLGAQNLLGRHGKERAGLHCGVVGDDHAEASADAAEAGDDARAGCAAVFAVHFVSGPEAKFEEPRLLVEQQIQPFSDSQTPFCVLCLVSLLTAALSIASSSARRLASSRPALPDSIVARGDCRSSFDSRLLSNVRLSAILPSTRARGLQYLTLLRCIKRKDGMSGGACPTMNGALIVQAGAAIDASLQGVHCLIDLVEALNGEEQVMHLIHLDRRTQYFVRTKGRTSQPRRSTLEHSPLELINPLP